MNKLRAFGVFWYDFLIGDDWRIAVGVIIGLGVSATAVRYSSFIVWWVLPLIIIGTLAASVRRAVRHFQK